MASDIAAGWGNQSGSQAPDSQTPGYPEAPDYPEGYDYYQGDDRRYTKPASGYDYATYDELDQGWENFDHYDSPPPPREEASGKRVYGDSLYGSDNREEVYEEIYGGPYSRDAFPEEGFPEEDFPEDDFLEDPPNEIGPDGVYEADYRVIEPPSKPLNDEDNDALG